MAVAHSKAFFDRFQVETTGLTFQPLRSYTMRPSTAARFEIALEAFDGTNTATFRRVLSLRRGATGPSEIIGRVWHCTETTKSNVAFDLRVVMNPDGGFTLEGKNASAVTTTWKATIERLAITR
jgi:hypothetical protein